MLVGVPKEIKVQEHRVALTPGGAAELCRAGHTVRVQHDAGTGAGFADADYEAAGAELVASAEAAWNADLVVKVKEPQAAEFAYLSADQMVFTYLHLAAARDTAEALLNAGTVAIAYETVTDAAGRLPLLAPMSEVAGRMSAQAAAWFLQKPQGGSGVLPGGVPGVEAAEFLVIGGGSVGQNAIRMAMGLGAHVTVLDRSRPRLVELEQIFGSALNTAMSTRDAIERLVPQADAVIGAVLVVGAQAPKLVRRETLARMRPGSVVVDVAIDQGGCFETSRPTSHDDPVYEAEGVLHYCVTNMPGAVARTSTLALTGVTLPYVMALATKGARRALAEDAGLAAGLNVARGHVCHPAVAAALGQETVAVDRALAE
ncbi:MAG: alanine dehydrogenase [Alphaproteobacteria bacterium]